MVSKFSVILFLLLVVVVPSGVEGVVDEHHNFNSNSTGIQLPHHISFNAVSTSACSFSNSKVEDQRSHTIKLNLTHRFKPKESLMDSSKRDLIRIQTLHKRIIQKKNQNSISRLKQEDKLQQQKKQEEEYFSEGQLTATLESGVSLGSGEYLMDVFIGTPPKHFSLILDTGSDLNWIQSVPCYDCFEQNGPFYIPQESSSYRNISCRDPRCNLVSSPNPPPACKFHNQSCPYFYWYGDSSNTTGDFALETFTVNLTGKSKSEFKKVENVMFGAGHWNRGLFHGAAGLLGFGRGPLSFPSQLQSKYGHSFSYCFVNRNSDINISSKLIFGEDKNLLNHPELNFTSFVAGKENPVDTFYYVQIKSIIVGGEVVDIPEETWQLSPEGAGGTIVDSGTTLTYFAQPAYQIIKDAFLNKVSKYPLVKDFPLLEPCYNVSGVEKLDMPEFGIHFADGAVWNFPVENYFLRLEPEQIVCLAILGTPPNALSIIGNYQQQNFHILYDTKRSRLGFAPVNCADV